MWTNPELWEHDTRVFAWDRAAVEAVRAAAAAFGLRVALETTRRGVPYVTLPSLWLLRLPVEEWGMSVPSLPYLWEVVAHHDVAQIVKPLEEGEGLVTTPAKPDEPPQLGAEFQRWEL